jgi:hypothetical protein
MGLLPRWKKNQTNQQNEIGLTRASALHTQKILLNSEVSGPCTKETNNGRANKQTKKDMFDLNLQVPFL